MKILLTTMLSITTILLQTVAVKKRNSLNKICNLFFKIWIVSASGELSHLSIKKRSVAIIMTITNNLYLNYSSLI